MYWQTFTLLAAVGGLAVAIGKLSQEVIPDRVKEISCSVVHEFGKDAKFLSRKTERAAAFDKHGEIVIAKSGRKGTIRYTGDEVDKLRNTRLYVHNHSIHGNSFSGWDIKMMTSLGIKEMIAVGKEYTYFMKDELGKLKTQEERDRAAKEIKDEFDIYYKEAIKQAREKAQKLNDQGKSRQFQEKFEKDENLRISHQFWDKGIGKSLLVKYGLKYKRKPTRHDLWK